MNLKSSEEEIMHEHNKILSIVIPAYNISKYMDECLPYILNIRNLKKVEILIINDGSTDDTLNIASIYQKKFSDAVKVIDKENGGHGSVLNRGIEEATGKYFKVIDGDDWVKTNNLDRLIGELENTDADLVVNTNIIHNIKNGKEVITNMPSVNFGNAISFEEYGKKWNKLVPIHCITYKTSLLKENSIKFQENCFYEDIEYDLYPMQYVENVKVLDYPVYVYRVGNANQSVNKKNIVRNAEMMKTILWNLINYYQSLEKIEEYKRKYIEDVILKFITSNYGVFLKMDYGKSARDNMKKFDLELMKKSSFFYGKADMLTRKIRKNNWLTYTFFYVAYNLKVWKRGF